MIHLIIFIQIVDATIHILTNQAEPIRIISNFLIVVWVYVLVNKNNKTMDVGVISSYIFLNFIFLLMNGFTNDGSPRVFLYVAVSLTSLLSINLISKNKS
jgi:hypothetical protein